MSVNGKQSSSIRVGEDITGTPPQSPKTSPTGVAERTSPSNPSHGAKNSKASYKGEIISTPEQSERIQRALKNLPHHSKPSPATNQALKNVVHVIQREAEKEGVSPDGKFERIYQGVFDRFNQTESSPSTRHMTASQCLNGPSWATKLANQAANGINDKKRKAELPTFVQLEHVNCPSTSSGGFHVCPKNDPRWAQMSCIRRSVEGPVSAIWQTNGTKRATKTSSFFPPEYMQNQVGAFLSNENLDILSDYVSTDPLVSLAIQKDMGLRIERRRNPNHDMLTKSAYPVLRTLFFEKLDPTAEVPIMKEDNLGGQQTPAIAVPFEKIKDIKENLLRQPRGVAFINSAANSVIFDISNKLPECGVPHGIHLEVQLDAEEFAQMKLAIQTRRDSRGMSTSSSTSSSWTAVTMKEMSSPASINMRSLMDPIMQAQSPQKPNLLFFSTTPIGKDGPG